MSTPSGPLDSLENARGSSARYKYQRLRDRLRHAVRSGELAGKLPGERELARRYDANAKTINKALCDLAGEGLLIRHVGRGTFVSDGANPVGASRRKLLTYAWIGGPQETTTATSSTIFPHLESRLRSRGHRLVTLTVIDLPNGEIPDSAISPGQLRAWDGVAIAIRASDSLIADLQRRHLPTVLVENSHGRIRTNCVLPDYSHGAFELTQHLIRLGHQQVGLLTGIDVMPAAGSAEFGYRAAMQRHGLAPLPCSVVGKHFNWEQLLNDAARPTGLICIGATVSQRAHAACLAAQLRVPADISICSVHETSRIERHDVFSTTYQVRAEDVAHWVGELLSSASPGQSPRSVIVPGQLIDRGSTAPPPGRSAPEPQRPTHCEI